MTVGTQNLSLIDDRVAGDTRYYVTNPPKDINMRIPDQLLNTVGFIRHDAVNAKYGGTGFIVAIKGENDNAFLHFVTAKHVAEKVEHGPFIIGMNRKNGGKAMLRYEDARWFYHPTEADAVDVAVTVFGTSDELDLDVDFIPTKVFAIGPSIKHYGIGVGDEINIVGLFTKFSGSSRHTPIVRTGNVAMMPPDRIPVRGFEPMEAFLVEGRSIGGLSGSPVFVRHTVVTAGVAENGDKIVSYGLGQALFFGLMHGHWDLPLDFRETEQAEAVNMGISIVVPAEKIWEVLHHPELVKVRREIDEEMRKEKLPTQDSELAKPFTKADFESALKKVSRRVGNDSLKE